VQGNAHLPYVLGLGLVDRRVQHDGKATVLVFPKAIYRKGGRRRVSNVPWPPPNEPDLADDKGPSIWSGKFFRSKMLPREFTRGLPTISEECVRGEKYFIEDGLRRVKPYYILLDGTVGERYARGGDFTLVRLIGNMMANQSREWLQLKLQMGLLMVNFSSEVDVDAPLKGGDLVTHLVHKHEHPALDIQPEVIHEDSELLVVNKPPSYPINPAGGNRLNSLLFLLKKEFNYDDLRPLHRLDKPTSGVCFLAKVNNVSNLANLRTLFTGRFGCHQVKAIVWPFREWREDGFQGVSLSGGRSISFWSDQMRSTFELIHCKVGNN